jgi:serine/threonine protein kinase/pimeloyl-ACP methyl ester carboxylesterase
MPMSDAEEHVNSKLPPTGPEPPAGVPGPRLEAGTQVGHFRIESEIGRGGMGVVYLAQDTTLGRSVAIKSLPAEVMEDPKVRSRFLQEAKLLASLNHPNIAAIHEELEETEGAVYLVLEYVPGQTLGERIPEGGFTLKETLSIACEIADAVSYAHDKGVIHRDLKPGNIKITPEGRIKVLDLGVAKMIGAPSSAVVTITVPGQVVGTPGYMSPEQARGDTADHRTDIWSFGCILFEMLAGTCPFPGRTASEALASILKTEPDWDALPAEVGADVREIIRRCLEKDPAQRYQSVNALCEDLHTSKEILTAPPSKPIDLKALLKLLKRPKAEVLIALLLLVTCLTAYGVIRHVKNARWAISAIPDIIRLIETDQYLLAFQLAKKVEKYIPNNSTLQELWPEMAKEFSIVTNPPGAEIYFRNYKDVNRAPLYLGKSPLREKWFPHGVFRWEIRKAGFDTRECILSTFPNDSSKLEITLLEQGLYPEMVLVKWNDDKDSEVNYVIDKYEVTNKQYKEFVDHGGYQKSEYWKQRFTDENGQQLTFKEAMDRFRDQTNLNAPATWEGGTYPEGQDDHPVGGVSWYEAAAYAEFIGKMLPPLDLWNQVAAAEWALVVLDYSNFGGELTRVGHSGGISPYGAYDMAGNVREWVWNAPDDTQRTRYIRGGACNDADYMFTRWDIQSTWKRYAENGFRCVQLLTDGNEPPEELFSPKGVPSWIRTEYPTDFVKRPEGEIRTWVEGFAYDRSDLKATVVSKEERRYWRKEKVIFNAAYDSDKIIANLFIPKNTEPPYQPILYFPGTGAQQRSSSDNLKDTELIDFIIKSGRAVLYPVYKGTYERQFRQDPPNPYSQPAAYREWMQQLAADVGRSIDYLAERRDMDMEKLTYYGLSWGAYKGPIFMRVEQKRIKYGMLFGGGLFSVNIWRPQVDNINYCGHVKAPVLMINGLQDALFPIETSARAMYDLLGSQDKLFLTYDGGHSLWGLISPKIKGDVLKWMDEHLGPVDFESQKP